MMRLAACSIALAMAALTPAASAHETRSAQVHAHGAAEIDAVLDGQDLMIEIRSAMWNLVGFEAAPASDAQLASWRAARAALENPGAILTLPAPARCTFTGSELGVFALSDADLRKTAHSHDDHGHSQGDNHDAADGPDFHDARLVYRFACAQPNRLSSLDFRVFATFPDLKEAMLTYVGPGTPRAARLRTSSPGFRIN